MSTIDEIMEAVESVKTAAAGHQRWPSAMRRIILGKETDGLRDLITAALADARREGAEAMRAKAAQGWDGCMYNAPGETLDIGTDIRALPPPESTVEVVMDREHGGLTFAPAKRAVDGHGWTVSELQVEDIPGMARDIEAAVLAANNLGVRRG